MIDPIQPEWDYKRDMQALTIALSAAFWIGFLMGEGTLGLALFIGVSLYIGIRVVHLAPLTKKEKSKHGQNRTHSMAKGETSKTS